jgi:two-component system, NarL family, response regulator DesR
MKRNRNGLKAVRTVRVLIVDDHALFAEALMLTLTIDSRIDVVGHAAGGQEALALARSLRPDVVLMDLHMPGMDGIEATRELLRVLPTVRIVMVTASSAPRSMRLAREAGAVRYLTKDSPARDLLDAVVEVASMRSPLLVSQVPERPTLGRTA